MRNRPDAARSDCRATACRLCRAERGPLPPSHPPTLPPASPVHPLLQAPPGGARAPPTPPHPTPLASMAAMCHGPNPPPSLPLPPPLGGSRRPHRAPAAGSPRSHAPQAAAAPAAGRRATDSRRFSLFSLPLSPPPFPGGRGGVLHKIRARRGFLIANAARRSREGPPFLRPVSPPQLPLS